MVANNACASLIVYNGTKEDITNGWVFVMKPFLERVHANSSTVDKTSAIIDHLLKGETRNYNKYKPERDIDPDLEQAAISGKPTNFHSSHSTRDGRLTALLRTLEEPRNQRIPDEPITTRRYEILQRFVNLVRDTERTQG